MKMLLMAVAASLLVACAQQVLPPKPEGYVVPSLEY
jgi:uncharacterized lipoprotein YmbA